MTIPELIARIRREIQEPTEEQSSISDAGIVELLQDGYDDLIEETRAIQDERYLKNTAITFAVATNDILTSSDVHHFPVGDSVTMAGELPAPIQDTVTAATGVNTGTETFTSNNSFDWATGEPVTMVTDNTMPVPLVSGTTYYVIYVDGVDFRLASTAALAEAGTPIDITNAGAGTHTVERVNKTVYVSADIRPISEKKLKLSLTEENAHDGTVIDFTTTTTATTLSGALRCIRIPKELKVIDVKGVYYYTDGGISHELADVDYQDYQRGFTRTTGTPDRYTVNSDRIWLYPALPVGYNIKYNYDRYGYNFYLATDASAVSLSDYEIQEPEIPAGYHKYLADYAISKILRQEGASRKAAEYLNDYYAGRQEMKGSNLKATSRGNRRIRRSAIRRR